MTRDVKGPRSCCAEGCGMGGASKLLRANGVRFRAIFCDIHAARLEGIEGPPEKLPKRSPMDAMTRHQADQAIGIEPAPPQMRPRPSLDEILEP